MRSMAEIKRAWDAGFWIPRDEEDALMRTQRPDSGPGKRAKPPAAKRKARATNGSNRDTKTRLVSRSSSPKRGR